LDRQSNSHPFQFPNWMGERNGHDGEDAYCALVREQGEVRWFALCGVIFPAGKWLRRLRSLTIYRGPVCDDAELTRCGLRKLLDKSKELGFAYVEIAPDWVERSEMERWKHPVSRWMASAPGAQEFFALGFVRWI
jgi:hypothetical protein